MENVLKKNSLVFDEYTEVDGKCTKLVPREFALNNLVIPFHLNRNKLYVAMENINNEELIERLKLLTRREIIPCQGREKEIYKALQSFYEKVEVERTVETLQKTLGTELVEDISGNIYTSEINSDLTVKLTDAIINRAINKIASDIHIEPQECEVRVRFRVDGQLIEALQLPNELHGAVVNRIKIMGAMDIAEKRIPQDGKARYRFEDKNFDLRISALPTLYGEKIVIRILYKSIQLSKLSNLGFSPQDNELINRALKHSHGIILITGPTGSGKSSTMYAMLSEINSSERNITTVEDPVEISMNGINQVNVNTKAGVTFAEGLKSILRQDPDIILLGEIRDEETAEIAVRAAITGHLVLSTLHTNDSISSINRLNEMKIPKYLLADAVVMIIAQRLVRKICTKCKKEYEVSDNERMILAFKGKNLYRGEGCSECNGSGYLGRQAVCEILYLDNSMKELILKGEDYKLKDYQKKRKSNFLIDNCRQLVLAGVTTFEEFLRLSNSEIAFERNDS
jgi:type IV pilus assembly protein PilB